MKSDKMKQAYPLPAELTDTLKKRLDTLPERQKSSAFRRRLPALALALLLMIGAVALADSQWGILQYLRSMGEPTGDTQGLDDKVTSVSQSKTAFNTRVSILDAVFDGQRIAFSLEYQNTRLDEPVYLTLTGFTAGGQSVRIQTENDTPDHIWLPGIYWTEGHTQNGLFGQTQEKPAPGPLPVSLTVSVFKPLKPIHQITPMEGEGDGEGYQPQIKKAYEEGFLPVIEDSVALPQDVMTDLAAKRGGVFPELQEALPELGLMTREDLRFDFTLTVSAD